MSDHPSIPPEPTLKGARLTLRPLRESDADDLFAMQSDPRVMRYWSHAPWTERAQAVDRIAQLARDRANAEFYTWASTLGDADRLIGTVSLFAINRTHRRAEVGYALAGSAWGFGYATEGLRLAIAYAFETIGLARLEADIDPRNEASCRVVERIGFRREGLLRARWRVAGEVTDSAMYGLLGE
ncbi:MAG TPA: GNAT family N-acetyltransferase, partial [Rhodanobacteraceae bacterium]|nr:GNAT family N-acetyltransferase [Rhodanobacteraceae bacterium]